MAEERPLLPIHAPHEVRAAAPTLVRFDTSCEGQRLDLALVRMLNLSRKHVKRMLDAGLVRVESRVVGHAGTSVRAGQYALVRGIELGSDTELLTALRSEHILWRDASLVFVHKPAGLRMHEIDAADQVNLLESLRRMLSSIESGLTGTDLYIVSRLDKETSGVVPIALNKDVSRLLARAYERREIGKHYLALVQGNPGLQGEISLPITPGRAGSFRADPGGMPATTRFRALKIGSDWSVVQASPLTGRPHQLRVHFAALGHPLVGDVRYGGRRRPGCPRAMLHAWRLELMHPLSGERLRLEAAPPGDLASFIQDPLPPWEETNVRP